MEADDKFHKAHYFIERMMNEYHSPAPFRYNLNAFLQALRSVTFRLQKVHARRDGFKEWYAEKQNEMRQDPVLLKFVEGRNVVVKQRNLMMNSKARIGFFRWRMLKIGLVRDVPAHVSSQYLVEVVAPKLEVIDEEHSAIGEQYGVQREWDAPELGDGNVLSLCDSAWVRVGRVLSAAHEFAGWHFQPPPEHVHDPKACDTLLEMDINPGLPEKWGWV